MVVVGIVGVLAAVGLPSMRNLLLTNRMKTLSLDVYTSLALARSEAIKRNSNNVSMIPTAGVWQKGWTVCVDTNANGACDAGEEVVIAADAVDASVVLQTFPPVAVITFNRDGRLATAATAFGIIYTANNAAVPMRCVYLSVSGRPKTLADTNATDSDGCN